MTAQRNIAVSIATRIVVCAILLIAAIATFIALKQSAPKPVASHAANATPRVLVMQARPVPIQRQWEGFGTVRAMESANVPARVTATVIERPEEIRAGRNVTKGQLLVGLDDSDFQRQVEIATQAIRDIDAQLNRLEVEEQSWTRRAEIATEDVRLARADFERVQQALQRDAARQRELDQAQQSLNTAIGTEVATREELDKIGPRRASLLALRLQEEATRRLAVQNVERSRIASPIDGVLQSVDVEIGENIAAGQRVARIVSLHRVEVPLLLPASARPLVSVGDAVTLRGNNAEIRLWDANVTRISPEDDAATRTMQVFVEVQQDPAQGPILAPGQFVQGVVTSSDLQDRWLVPRRAIDHERVMLIEDGRVKSVQVEGDFTIEAEVPALGLPDLQWVVLDESLPSNALVVVDSSRTLAEGTPVTPVIATTARAEQSNSNPGPGESPQ